MVSLCVLRENKLETTFVNYFQVGKWFSSGENLLQKQQENQTQLHLFKFDN